MQFSWLALLGLAAAGAAAPPGCGAGAKGLRSWLCGLTFKIPDLDVSGTGFELEIIDLACKGLELGQVTSSVAPSTAKPTLSLGVTDVAISCTTDDVKLKKPLPISARMDLRLSEVAVSSTLQLSKAGGLATSAALQGTKVDIGKVDVSLPNAPHWVSSLVNLIEKALQGTIESKIKSALENLVTVNGTQALQELDAAVKPYLTPPVTRPEPVPPPGAGWGRDGLDWRGSGALRTLDFGLNQLVGADGPLGLNGLVSALTGGTGGFGGNVSLPPTPPLPIGPLGNLSIALRAFSVSGLDSISSVRLLTAAPAAAERHSLRLGVGLDALSVRVSLGLTALPSGQIVNASELDEVCS